MLAGLGLYRMIDTHLRIRHNATNHVKCPLNMSDRGHPSNFVKRQALVQAYLLIISAECSKSIAAQGAMKQSGQIDEVLAKTPSTTTPL